LAHLLLNCDGMNVNRDAAAQHGLEAVQAVLRALAAGASIDEALDLVVERTRALLDATEAMVLLIQEGRLLLRAAHGIAGPHLPRPAFADEISVESWVAHHDTPLFVADVSREPRFHDAPGRHERTVSLAAVPIRVGDAVVGVLEVRTTYSADFAGSAALLETLADAVGIVVEHDAAMRQACESAAREYIRTIRHDLKSPLTAIHGYAQMIQRRATREDRAADVRTALIISEQVQRMLGMLDRLRDAPGDRASQARAAQG